MPTATDEAFWALTDRWRIADTDALRLIDHGPTASGKRPRFALTTEQTGRLELLQHIDTLASDAYGDAGDWIRRPNSSTVFEQKPPLHLMMEGEEGMQAVLRYLTFITLGTSMRHAADGKPKPPTA